jgi:hypothetical protein
MVAAAVRVTGQPLELEEEVAADTAKKQSSSQQISRYHTPLERVD